MDSDVCVHVCVRQAESEKVRGKGEDKRWGEEREKEREFCFLIVWGW